MTTIDQKKDKHALNAAITSNAPNDWQSTLSNGITDPEQLFALLDLDSTQLPAAFQSSSEFPLRVPLSFVAKIKPGDPKDPLLLQILPRAEEQDIVPGFSKDPLLEEQFTPTPGLLHKYEGRALLIVSPSCVVNCRYCFRRHFPYQNNHSGIDQWRNALQYIRQTPSINEVILSGGDPLAINNRRLGRLVQQLDEIPHLTRLRIHTRFPIMVPGRIDQALVDLLAQSRLQKVMVLHSNHGNELDHTLGNALLKLHRIGMTLLNQTVLLKSINDDIHCLCELSEKLFKYNILPYYLHLLDPVQGAAHFSVDERLAVELVNQLRCRLPGYLVPKLVKEQAFAAHKIPICC